MIGDSGTSPELTLLWLELGEGVTSKLAWDWVVVGGWGLGVAGLLDWVVTVSSSSSSDEMVTVSGRNK